MRLRILTRRRGLIALERPESAHPRDRRGRFTAPLRTLPAVNGAGCPFPIGVIARRP